MNTTGGKPWNYLERNRDLAGDLVGKRLRVIERLLFDLPRSDEDPRLTWGPALITDIDGGFLVVDSEESKANILLRPGLGPPGTWLTLPQIRSPIVTDSVDDPLRFLLHESIASIEVISRDPEPGVPDSFAMCGLRLTTSGDNRVCLGTHLSKDIYPEVAFRLPGQVDEGLHYSPL